ncbi:MAG: hypothetical protein ACXWF8_09030 [Methylobacter sp.]
MSKMLLARLKDLATAEKFVQFAGKTIKRNSVFTAYGALDKAFAAFI